MSRSATRARRRRARIEEQIEACVEKTVAAASLNERISSQAELVQLLRRVAASDECLWSYAAQVVGTGEDADATNAMIAQIVAPALAARAVRRRPPTTN